MQPVGQGSQGQRADAQLSEQLAYLSQAHSDTSQTLDLSVYLITDALIRTEQAPKVDSYTSTTYAPHSRQSEGHLSPDRDEWLATTEAIPAETSTPSRAAAAAFALSTESFGYFDASNVVPTAYDVTHNCHQHCGESRADRLA